MLPDTIIAAKRREYVSCWPMSSVTSIRRARKLSGDKLPCSCTTVEDDPKLSFVRFAVLPTAK
jgi:hypothetical protein